MLEWMILRQCKLTQDRHAWREKLAACMYHDESSVP